MAHKHKWPVVTYAKKYWLYCLFEGKVLAVLDRIVEQNLCH